MGPPYSNGSCLATGVTCAVDGRVGPWMEHIGGDETTIPHLREFAEKAHLGEVSVSVWTKVLKHMCKRKSIQVLD